MKIIGYLLSDGSLLCPYHGKSQNATSMPVYGTSVERSCTYCSHVIEANRTPGRKGYKELKTQNGSKKLTRNQS
jgi:hypothetical protein